jgi:hypothetical protein
MCLRPYCDYKGKTSTIPEADKSKNFHYGTHRVVSRVESVESQFRHVTTRAGSFQELGSDLGLYGLGRGSEPHLDLRFNLSLSAGHDAHPAQRIRQLSSAIDAGKHM